MNYAIRNFKDISDTIFLLASESEGNEYILTQALLNNKRFTFSENILLCRLDSKEFLKKSEDGDTLFHYFLLDEDDKEILAKSKTKKDLANKKHDVVNEMNPYMSQHVLSFKIVKSFNKLDILSKVIDNEDRCHH
jgi:predicted transcriptional regulator